MQYNCCTSKAIGMTDETPIDTSAMITDRSQFCLSDNPGSKNFGDVFTIWDRFFGSYYNGDSTKDKIILGVEDKNYHKPLYFKDIILILRKWILSNFKRNYQ